MAISCGNSSATFAVARIFFIVEIVFNCLPGLIIRLGLMSEKFLRDNTHLKINIEKIKTNNEPLINSSDEIIYSLGNIIQNAIEHARNSIDVNISWNKEFIFISIKDDGKGFTNEVLEEIGNPYISNKNNNNSMGLGIFIAKNLIENIGGNIKFYNEIHNLGSVVEISLNRHN